MTTALGRMEYPKRYRALTAPVRTGGSRLPACQRGAHGAFLGTMQRLHLLER